MPQITFDLTDAQLKQIDDLNAATNSRLAAGAKPSSRQTFAADAFGKSLASALIEEEKVVAALKAKGKAEAPKS